MFCLLVLMDHSTPLVWITDKKLHELKMNLFQVRQGTPQVKIYRPEALPITQTTPQNTEELPILPKNAIYKISLFF